MKNLDNLEERSMLFAEVSPAKPFQLQESNWDLRTLEELYSMKLLEQPKKSNHAIYCLRTSETYYHTIKGKHSLEYLKSWMNWGMMSSGKCLTAKISESHRIGNVSSLLDILEENVPTEFFLSEEKTRELILTEK